ncbi:hypothetical protein [Sphingorhabdus sp. YGSMI21]|uniref:hypothetical protein n=1 Tax=Sphingorhabdus sp. YGSMI21 TaxID=2077182 RepID=UPI000C1EE3F4|nr:hypothetical protein [Sphingorhabdus sp. YGSMI21]ATW04044.1 hypothetical protein CHN51_11280 [Sphingorhabdus sp. YGSMI21]
MVFVFDRERRALVDEDRKLLFKEAGMSGRPEDGFDPMNYSLQIDDTEFIRETIVARNDVFMDFSDERDKHNKRKYTVRLGDDPWIRVLTAGTRRVSGSALWTGEIESLFREAMYAFYTKEYGDHIHRIHVIFGIMGNKASLETFAPDHPVYEVEN